MFHRKIFAALPRKKMSTRGKRYSQQDITTLGPGLHSIALSSSKQLFSTCPKDPTGGQKLDKDVNLRGKSLTMGSNGMMTGTYGHNVGSNSGLLRSTGSFVLDI